MREMIKMVVVLSIICAGSGWILSTVRKATAPLIEEQVMTYVQGPALAAIFPGEADQTAIKDRKILTEPNGEKITVFPIFKDGTLKSVAFEAFGGGYGGPVGIMIGFSLTKNELAGIGLTTHKETPGLGARAAEPEFTGQFAAHPFSGLSLKKNGGDIDAVSGATITSTGVTAAVAGAVKTFQAVKPQLLTAFSAKGAGQ
ncbi:MAG: RnfABCDGE type electron transport complex subunit G [Desulfovibrio sp.]|uniref:RnfABCDGE type electron transport complex subunit G n=1 Tax=Desulfovibrio sp. 7SRBS1 TaxID=3378064 RepID=UPI003B4155DF